MLLHNMKLTGLQDTSVYIHILLDKKKSKIQDNYIKKWVQGYLDIFQVYLHFLSLGGFLDMRLMRYLKKKKEK